MNTQPEARLCLVAEAALANCSDLAAGSFESVRVCAAANHSTKHVAVVVAEVVRLAVAGQPATVDMPVAPAKVCRVGARTYVGRALPQNQMWAESTEIDPVVACTADKHCSSCKHCSKSAELVKQARSAAEDRRQRT